MNCFLVLLIIFYSIGVLAINQTSLESLKNCPPPIPCNQTEICGAPLIMSEHGIVDVRNKILFEYTPKAGCTSGVTTFLLSLGIDVRSYEPLELHNFYKDQYLAECAGPTVCLYLAKDWFRFKVVRNPYLRVISSYTDLMIRRHWSFVPKNLTFEQFIQYLNKLNFWEFIDYGYRHGGLQSRPYEHNYYKSTVEKGFKDENPIFHEIVKLEELEAGYERIFARTGVRYTPEKKYVRKAKKKHFSESYVGNLSWSELKDFTPDDLSVFYNEELFRIVTKLFHWDLLLYNYTYPFRKQWSVQSTMVTI